MQVVAHIAAATVLNSVLQYLRAGQITPLAKPTSGHRPLLMMSFLRQTRVEVCYGSKERISGKMCWPVSVWCWKTRWCKYDDQDHPVPCRKPITPEFLLPSTSRLLSRMSPRRAMLRSIPQTDADLAAVYSRWYTGTTEHRRHYESAYTKITANSGVDQGCPLSACGFSAVVDPTLHSIMSELCNLYDSGAQLFRLPRRLVPMDQAELSPTDHCSYHSCYQFSQSCSTDHKNTNLERLMPRPNSS